MEKKSSKPRAKKAAVAAGSATPETSGTPGMPKTPAKRGRPKKVQEEPTSPTPADRSLADPVMDVGDYEDDEIPSEDIAESDEAEADNAAFVKSELEAEEASLD